MTTALQADKAAKKAEQLQRHQRVAEGLKKGLSISRAMTDAGYPKARASRGATGLPKGVKDQLLSDGERYIKLGKQYKPEDRAHMVRGLLLENVLVGKDKAVKSAELLGKDTAVNIFRTEGTNVAVQINLPAGMEDLFSELADSKTGQSVDLTNTER